ncbi:hypothetical protein ETAA8_36240 [Anatilimnocola aggregata]|uniref:Uncharacterized protein n=1 Tax=Anatilimnocola aggregata TaxID=2528021 RepID=A0A517YEC0_9BACT|nr:hypothetical protein ETAA8_36240 [Anatilimnocola aggregata]
MTNRAPLIVAIVLLLLPVLYVGSYLALVVPGGIPRVGVSNVDGRMFRQISREHDYRIDSELASWLFWPLEQIDRKMRPEAWEQSGNLLEEDVRFPPPLVPTSPKPNSE